MEDLTGCDNHPPFPWPIVGFDHYPISNRQVQIGRIEVMDTAGGFESYSNDVGHVLFTKAL